MKLIITFRSLLFCSWAAGMAMTAATRPHLLAQAPAAALRNQAASETARAERLQREEKPGEALPLLLEAHRTAPGDFRVCHLAGLAYTKLQEFEKAAEFYRKARQLNPGFVPSRKNLATVLWFSNHKTEAEREFLSVTKAQPGDPVAHFYLRSLVALAAGAAGEFGPALQIVAGIAGGTLAAGSHFTKAGSRALINTSPEPFSNWAASLTEDALVVTGIWAAVTHPLWFLAGLALFIAIAIWLLPKLWRGVRRMLAAVGGRLGPARKAPDAGTPE